MKKKTNKRILESGIAKAKEDAAKAAHCICPECGSEGSYLATSYKGRLSSTKYDIYMCSCKTKWEVCTGEKKKFKVKKLQLPEVIFAILCPVIVTLLIIGFAYTVEGFLQIGIPCLLISMIMMLVLMYSEIDKDY